MLEGSYPFVMSSGTQKKKQCIALAWKMPSYKFQSKHLQCITKKSKQASGGSPSRKNMCFTGLQSNIRPKRYERKGGREKTVDKIDMSTSIVEENAELSQIRDLIDQAQRATELAQQALYFSKSAASTAADITTKLHTLLSNKKLNHRITQKKLNDDFSSNESKLSFSNRNSHKEEDEKKYKRKLDKNTLSRRHKSAKLTLGQKKCYNNVIDPPKTTSGLPVRDNATDNDMGMEVNMSINKNDTTSIDSQNGTRVDETIATTDTIVEVVETNREKNHTKTRFKAPCPEAEGNFQIQDQSNTNDAPSVSTIATVSMTQEATQTHIIDEENIVAAPTDKSHMASEILQNKMNDANDNAVDGVECNDTNKTALNCNQTESVDDVAKFNFQKKTAMIPGGNSQIKLRSGTNDKQTSDHDTRNSDPEIPVMSPAHIAKQLFASTSVLKPQNNAPILAVNKIFEDDGLTHVPMNGEASDYQNSTGGFAMATPKMQSNARQLSSTFGSNVLSAVAKQSTTRKPKSAGVLSLGKLCRRVRNRRSSTSKHKLFTDSDKNLSQPSFTDVVTHHENIGDGITLSLHGLSSVPHLRRSRSDSLSSVNSVQGMYENTYRTTH